MIYLDEAGGQTVCICDRCGEPSVSTKADGVAASGWLTGQLWIDVSLAEQRHMPLCFCTACRDVILLAETVQISAGSLGGIPEPDPDALRAKQSLTRPQLLVGLVTEGWISQADGEAWLAGILPAPIVALIETLPGDQQFAARAKALTATTFPRLEPLVLALASLEQKSPEDMDAFFSTWGQF